MHRYSFFICAIIFLLITSLFGYHVVSAKENIKEEKDILIQQNEQNSYFSTYGYSIENPNIIVNPYFISPLTAIMLFETDKEEIITVTIHGKTSDTDISYTFNSSKKHMIPIYGLYADYDNVVSISSENYNKDYIIKTDKIPDTIIPQDINYDNFTFISSDLYPYAVDKNGDIRWFLTQKYYGEMKQIDNGHFLLGGKIPLYQEYSNDLLEIDLLGKIYYQYHIPNGYYGDFEKIGNKIYALSNDLLEIDSQNGEIINMVHLDNVYQGISYYQEDNVLRLNGDQSIKISLDSYQIAKDEVLNSEKSNRGVYSFYNDKNDYKIVNGIKFSNCLKTKESKKNIFLVGYKKIDKNYLNYHIKFYKQDNYLNIVGDFSDEDKVYVILDQFLNKKVYKMNKKNIIIYNKGLSGKYSIYIKINKDIYQTNQYINF